MQRMILICLAFVMSLAGVQAQDEPKFDVNSVIAEPVGKLGEPKFWQGVGELDLLVFTEDEVARKHVNQGFVLLHASWDFEAYRHFAAALKRDPDCLMAYCGVVLSLANPAHEWREERAKAFNRMVTMTEFKVGEGEDAQWYYPDIERGYAFCIGTLLTEGSGAAAKAFRLLSEKYPKDLQLQLLAALLERGGYSEFGDVRPSQRKSLEKVKALMKEHPENPLVLNFWVMMQAEAPHQAVDVSKVLVPTAKRMVTLSEGKMPTWHAVLGHLAWRSGELELARLSFERAIELYTEWQKSEGVSSADAVGLLRAKIYLATVLYDEGKVDEALKLLDEVKAVKIPEGREFSQAAIAIKWHADLMPAQIYLAREKDGDLKKAMAALPKTGSGGNEGFEPYKGVVDSYIMYIRALMAQKSGDIEQAREWYSKMAAQLGAMSKAQKQVVSQPYFGDFIRVLGALNTHHYELTGLITTEEALVYNWYKGAISRQQPSSRLLPPEILYPMEYRMAAYYKRLGQKEEAIDYAKQGLERMPSCPKCKALLKALE